MEVQTIGFTQTTVDEFFEKLPLDELLMDR
jgi:hypothetical protein